MSKKILYILMILAMIGWGETWISAKILGSYLGAEELIFWRFFFTTIGMVPIISYLKISLKISLRNLGLAIGCAIILALYNRFFFLGTFYGFASFGAVMVTTLVPIITFVFVSILSNKYFNSKEIVGLIFGAIGVLIILKIWQFNLGFILSQSNLYFLIATVLWPLLTLVSAKQGGISPLAFSFYMFLFTSVIDLLFLKFELTNIAHFDIIFWSNLLLLSLYGTTFATTIYFIAVTQLGSKKASSFFFLVPSSAIVFAYLFLNETIEISLILGGLFTIASVYMLNAEKKIIKQQADEIMST